MALRTAPRLKTKWTRESLKDMFSLNYRIVHIPTGINCYCGYTTRPDQRAAEHAKPNGSRISKLIAKLGYENFLMIFHNGNPEGEDEKTLLHELKCIKRYRTSFHDHKDNPYACNERMHMSASGRRTGIEFQFAGQEFTSVNSCAIALGYSSTSITNWIAQGLTKPPPGWKVAVEFGGIKFESLSDCAVHFDTSPGQIRRWVKKGLTEPPPYRFIRVFMDGLEFKTRAEAAAHYGVSDSIMKGWIDAGLTESPSKWGWNKPIHFGGKDFESMAECARHFKTNYNMIRRWIDQGLDAPPADYKRRPNIDRGTRIEFGGRKFRSFAAGARHFGINRNTLARWIRAGLKKPPTSKRGGTRVKFEGQWFESYATGARHYGVKHWEFQYWVKTGMKKPPAKMGNHVSFRFDGREIRVMAGGRGALRSIPRERKAVGAQEAQQAARLILSPQGPADSAQGRLIGTPSGAGSRIPRRTGIGDAAQGVWTSQTPAAASPQSSR